MKLEKYYKTLKETSPEIKLFVKRNLDILDRIHYLLNDKFDGKQKLLAEKMGKSEAEVSKMINGFQNFTQKTITKLEIAFGEPIQTICKNPEVESALESVREL